MPTQNYNSLRYNVSYTSCFYCDILVYLANVLLFLLQGLQIEPSLFQCSKPECNSSPLEYITLINNKLLLDIRRHIKKYYNVSDVHPIWYFVCTATTELAAGYYPGPGFVLFLWQPDTEALFRGKSTETSKAWALNGTINATMYDKTYYILFLAINVLLTL